MGKKVIMAIAVVLVVLFAFSVMKDVFVKVAIEKGAEIVTGLKLNMRSLSIGIVRSRVDIKDLKIFNPLGYKDRVMLDMPGIYVDYDLPGVFKGKIHLYEAKIDLKQFVVVKNEDGQLNLNSLKTVQEGKEPKEVKAKEKGKAPEIRIDSLELKVGKVIYKDYSKGGEPSVQEFNINLDEKYTNIDNPNALVSLIVFKALANTTIAKLANFDMKLLKGNIGDTLASAQQMTAGLTGKAQEAFAGATQGTGKTLSDTTATLQKTTQGLTEAIGNPFGEKKK
ncbi:MAG: hypothetical protein PHW46_02885 [Candidatus Omnitrophica bacterium]|nr:hypothetical protein [Candidatus Omnitrophota bacterium]